MSLLTMIFGIIGILAIVAGIVYSVLRWSGVLA